MMRGRGAHAAVGRRGRRWRLGTLAAAVSVLVLGVPAAGAGESGDGQSGNGGGVFVLVEGEQTKLTLRLSRPIEAHQSATFRLAFTGADIGSDFTLSLDAATNPGVSVDVQRHLGTSGPQVTLTGVQQAVLTLAAVEDSVAEGTERLTIAAVEVVYNDGVIAWVPQPVAPISVDIADAPPKAAVAEFVATVIGDTWATLAWPPAAGDVDYYALVWYSPELAGSEEIYTSDTTATITGLDAETVYDAVVIPFARDGTILDSMTGWFTTQASGETFTADLPSAVTADAASDDDDDDVSDDDDGDDDLPRAVPRVSVSTGGAVVEGGVATFTVTASPAPAAPLAVKVSVSESGAFVAAGGTGAKTVTVPTSGSATYSVATVDDSVDEPDGSVTVAVAAGAGYAVAPSGSIATIAVTDNDDPSPQPEPTLTPEQQTDHSDQDAVEFKLTSATCAAANSHYTITVTWQGGGPASPAVVAVQYIETADGAYQEQFDVIDSRAEFQITDRGLHIVVLQSGNYLATQIVTC